MITTALAGSRMGRRLTTPFARGADVHDLALTPWPDAGTAQVAEYGFADHEAQFGRAPQPSYVLRTLRDLDVSTEITVAVEDPALPGGTATIRLQLAAGTMAGQSFVLGLPAGSGPDARLTRLTVTPAAAAPETAWSITALLGTTAKLLWVLGWERDNLRRHAARTAEQRRLATAISASLDLIGADLAVPRFPPLPHGFDPDTVALYHCDDVSGAVPAVEDFTGLFPGRPTHHGTPAGGATPGAAGRFRTGIAFLTPQAAVTVASSPDFDVPAGRGFTVECFVRPAADSTDGRVLARRSAGGRGWSVELGEFGRGLPRNVQLLISDGATQAEVFGDVSLPTERFTHLAAVLDRGAATLALWLDGRQVAAATAAGLAAVGPTAPLVIGPAGTGFRGIVDEVRISSVARADFAPVLGEGDEHYRRRLALFRRWVLPTPGRLATLLNETVGQVGGMADPIVVDDGDGALIRGTSIVRVVPAILRPGESIDAAGRRGVTEAQLYDPDGDRGFDAALLSRHDRPGVSYPPAQPRALQPGEPAADPHLMQPPVIAALDGLIELTAAAGLVVEGAFDPRTADARAIGRAVLLTHTGVEPGRLAALAHRAGFDLVRHLPRGGPVYCSCAPGRLLSLVVTPQGGRTEVVVGEPAVVHITPTPPADAQLRFLAIPSGPGRGTVTAEAHGTARFVPQAPGQVVIVAEVTRGGRTVSGSIAVPIGLTRVENNTSIAADGRLGVGEDVVGEPEPTFDPVLLTRHDDPRVSYGAKDANHLMQLGVARTLTALLDRLTAANVAGTLTVVSAFRPAAGPPDLASRGRALTVRHSTLGPGELAAAAHAVGFGFVGRAGQVVELRHGTGQLIAVEGPTELEEGATAPFVVRPDPAVLGPETRLHWSTGGLADGAATISTTTQPTAHLIGQRAGRVWLQAVFHEAAGLRPYEVEVRLRPELVAANATLTRDQYDLIMNVLHALHPVGVEVITRGLRAAVVELRGDALDADPIYTYPKFRLHRSAARLRGPAQKETNYG